MLPATRGAPFLDPKFAQEHDERISFGHRARVQQPERARNQQPARLPGRHPARARASNRNRGAHPGRSQNSDHACTQSVGFMHARVDGRPRMRWNGVDCQDGAGCSLALRNLLRANSSARGTSDHWPTRRRARAAQKLPNSNEQPAPSISLRLWEKHSRT